MRANGKLSAIPISQNRPLDLQIEYSHDPVKLSFPIIVGK